MERRAFTFFALLMVAAIVGGALLLDLIVGLDNAAPPWGTVIVVFLFSIPVLWLLLAFAVHRVDVWREEHAPRTPARNGDGEASGGP